MSTFMIITSVVFLVAFPVLVLTAMWLDANWKEMGRFFTTVGTGTIRVITKGESIYKILADLPGHRIGRDGQIIKEKNLIGGLLEEKLGIYFVSLLYPIVKVAEFEVIADKINPEWDPKNPIRDMIKRDIRKVSFLRWKFPHPMAVVDIELGQDRWLVDLVMMFEIVITHPVKYIFEYNGRALELTDALVKGVVLDYCNDEKWNYQKFLNDNKGPKTQGGLESKILALNVQMEYFGIKIVSSVVYEFSLSPGQQELDNAIKAESLEKAKADALRAKSEGEKNAAILIAEGEKQRILLTGTAKAEMAEKLAGSLGKAEATKLLVAEQLRQGLAETKVGTLILGEGVKPFLGIDDKKD